MKFDPKQIMTLRKIKEAEKFFEKICLFRRIREAEGFCRLNFDLYKFYSAIDYDLLVYLPRISQWEEGWIVFIGFLLKISSNEINEYKQISLEDAVIKLNPELQELIMYNLDLFSR